MKSSKGDGVKYNQSKGSSAANETGPLFPRLHINDTEKAGPRAPPRNKMALYEQFTVPSHRFVQGSRTQTASANGQQQIGPNDYGYPYHSYYVPPAMPYGNMNYVVPSHTQPSFGMSSCVTSSGSALVCNQESQKTSKTLSAEKSASPGALRVVARKGGSATMMGLKTEHKSQDMSMRNASRQSPRKGDPRKFSHSRGMHRQCDMSDSVKLREGRSAMEVTEELQQALSIVEEVLECTMSKNHNRETSTCTETTNLEKRKEGNDLPVKGPASTDRPIEQADGIVPALPEQTVQLPVVHNLPVKILLHESLSLANDTPQADMNRDGSTSGEGHMAIEEEPAVRASGKDELQATPMEETSGTFSLCKDQETCLADGDNVAEKISVRIPLNTKDDSIRQVKNKQTNIINVSGPSQASCGGAPQGSMYSVEGTVSTHDFRPKDVIRAVGQRQFWKARKALLRQQRIFSDQVFQLHKLIKVQQLLAETPGTLIDDEMPFGAREENDASPLYQSFADGDLCPGEEGYNRGSSFGAKDEEPPHLEGTYSGDLQASEHVADGNGVESTPFMASPGPGGISAWGYPSQGIGQWMGPAPGGSFAYPLTAGAFTLGPPYGGLYGMPMPGTVPPLVPFGIPFSGQSNELQEEVSSNHGPAAARIQQNVTALGQMANHTPNDVAHMWQCLQYSNPHYSQWFYDNASSKGVPAGSIASINNQKALRTPSSSRMQHTLGMASHSVGVDANRREHSVHQGENLSSIGATKAQLKPSAPIPSSRRGLDSYRDVEQLARHPDSEDTRRPQGCIRSEAERAVVQTEADSGPMKSLKCYQNGHVASTNEDGEERSVCRYPLDHSENALDLFPQVPFLNSGPLVGWKQERLAEEGQSRVIKAIPRPAVAASQSTASILLSLQRQRHR